MKNKRLLTILTLTTALLGLGAGCTDQLASKKTDTVKTTEQNQKESDKTQNKTTNDHQEQTYSIEAIAKNYKGQKVVEVNGNRSDFTQEQLDKVRLKQTNPTWQEFSNLDKKNRVGVATALIGKEIQPKEKRDDRLNTKPTGWHQKKLSDGSTLFDRSHLIGYQLTGQNDNPKNLMTGTKDFNRHSMLKYENMVDKEVDKGSYVLYEVKPIFIGDELVARGVQMKAETVNNDHLDFNVFCYNVQDGVEIDYKDGTSKLAGKQQQISQ
ncbi:DNA/RNA non-specific endonuclease [Bacillus pseudomycoides]|uniref:DNA/RNA non-specific endonuclease n=1 Tax=Bacillus pseudomycoides TaxID=64104 RepID=UPI000BEE39F0|nr:DNA/RNA non-specific endonuclease [Bacillus pseudomycoides]PEB42251.1 DNA-entry nuclease [Bacillus pseudomycoides]